MASISVEELISYLAQNTAAIHLSSSLTVVLLVTLPNDFPNHAVTMDKQDFETFHGSSPGLTETCWTAHRSLFRGDPDPVWSPSVQTMLKTQHFTSFFTSFFLDLRINWSRKYFKCHVIYRHIVLLLFVSFFIFRFPFYGIVSFWLVDLLSMRYISIKQYTAW